jgi:hypothetical protein
VAPWKKKDKRQILIRGKLILLILYLCWTHNFSVWTKCRVENLKSRCVYSNHYIIQGVLNNYVEDASIMEKVKRLHYSFNDSVKNELV